MYYNNSDFVFMQDYVVTMMCGHTFCEIGPSDSVIFPAFSFGVKHGSYILVV